MKYVYMNIQYLNIAIYSHYNGGILRKRVGSLKTQT